MSEQERIMNVALLWGGCFCLTAAFCLSMGNDYNREKRNWLIWMELSAAALLCCDAAAWFVQGTPGEASHLIMVVTNFVVYAGLYLVLFLFNHYVGCYLREDGRLCAPKRSRAVDITCAVGIGLVFVSQFSPLFYYIDAQNIYHRSDTFPLSMVLLLIGMGTEITMMAQFYQKLTMGRRIAMFGCMVLPLSVAACQVFQDDISLISLSVGASMILLFVVATSAQNRELAVSERTKEQIRQRLEIATMLNSCVGKLNSDTDIDVGNAQYGGVELLVVFDDVFIPNENIYLNGETEFATMMVERFAGYHRQSYGGCKVGVGDVLIGASAVAADYNGVAKASHVKDKLIEMIHLNETMYSCGIACSAEGTKTASGNYLIDLLLANVCKQNVTRFPYEMARIAEDLAGGSVGTCLSEADLRGEFTGPWVAKYMKNGTGTTAENRMRILRLIENLSLGSGAVGYRTESLHGAGSPQAQRVMIARQGDIEGKKKLAKRIAHVKED